MTDTGITQEHVDIVERAGDVLEQLTAALVAERQKSARLAAALKELANACEHGADNLQDEDGFVRCVVFYEDIQPLLRQAVMTLAEVAGKDGGGK